LPDQHGCTPLLYAVVRDRLDIALYLLDRGAKATAETNEKQNLLFLLPETSADELARVLIAEGVRKGADPNDLDMRLLTPLHHAWTGAVVTALLSSGARPTSHEEMGISPLHTISQFATPSAIRALAAVMSVKALDAARRTPLHVASRAGNWANVQLLCELGADANIRDVKGETPLHACLRPQMLINNQTNDYSGTLGSAHSTEKTVAALLKCKGGAVAPNAHDKEGRTPDWTQIDIDDHELAEWLCQNDINRFCKKQEL